MTCQHVRVGNVRAIVCRGRRRGRRCSVCKALTFEANLRECDWKIEGGKTCDVLLCVTCSYVPAPDKDLCPTHAALWDTVRAAHAWALERRAR